MSIRHDRDLLEDIISSIEKIESYCEELNYSEFLNDSKTQDAIIRNKEIIGEAVSRVSIELKDNHPEIPWNNIKGTRNRLIHDYSGVNLDILWNIVKDDLPDLYLKITKIK
ncbi:MAG TPA: DUF86 domain-containing protein [Ignavibacteria bacterium]|nr:hypothetical protein [Bacteroidota bacterium]HRE12018.1 DUF86 domain-containing protein [Ignavibacteria bacterium]HRF65449.1 DUF86 domain-containing protein [Ignavibacteria bacterium]HRJ04550.1 DUF86 domain-containing protein [Ignavibacteria bacterium]HRJ85343.1 DUF86 domain-containing protein [Ignavibacteria bacterium]